MYWILFSLLTFLGLAYPQDPASYGTADGSYQQPADFNEGGGGLPPTFNEGGGGLPPTFTEGGGGLPPTN